MWQMQETKKKYTENNKCIIRPYDDITLAFFAHSREMRIS